MSRVSGSWKCWKNQGQGLNLTKEVRDGILNHKTAGRPSTLEGQIVRLSDKIAYIAHDTDDAIRGGILTEERIPKELRKTLGASPRQRMNAMIHDVITQSMDCPEIRMSPEIGEATAELRKFMFAEVYQNSRAKAEEKKAVHLVEQLYMYYIEHISELPEKV